MLLSGRSQLLCRLRAAFCYVDEILRRAGGDFIKALFLQAISEMRSDALSPFAPG